MGLILQKTFEQWLQKFNSKLHIEPVYTLYADSEGKHKTRERNPNVDVLYCGKKRICAVPKGLADTKGWSQINDVRKTSGYMTDDGTYHRTVSGIGILLLAKKLITPTQFTNSFMTPRQKYIINQLESRRKK